jgi:uncharacterized protein YeaO (DUF488 family)
MDAWCKNLAPSGVLRCWFSYDPVKWKEFHRRYRAELTDGSRAVSATFTQRVTKSGSTIFSCSMIEPGHPCVTMMSGKASSCFERSE